MVGKMDARNTKYSGSIITTIFALILLNFLHAIKVEDRHVWTCLHHSQPELWPPRSFALNAPQGTQSQIYFSLPPFRKQTLCFLILNYLRFAIEEMSGPSPSSSMDRG